MEAQSHAQRQVICRPGYRLPWGGGGRGGPAPPASAAEGAGAAILSVCLSWFVFLLGFFLRNHEEEMEEQKIHRQRYEWFFSQGRRVKRSKKKP